MTYCRVEPSGYFVAGIDHLMGARGSWLRAVLAPALESGGVFYLDSTQQNAHQSDLSRAERRVLIVATAAIAASQHNRAADVLKEHLEHSLQKVDPRIYERLAAVYLAMDRGDEAVKVARDGLEAHEDDPRLILILINALASQSEWAAALSQWENLPRIAWTGADVWTHISIVRAHRKTGDPAQAERLARDAAALWPENVELQREIQLCRPHAIDWTQCWIANVSDDGGPPADGKVESMGFLTNRSSPLVGWLGTCAGDKGKISLTVNGSVVAGTDAAPDSGEQLRRRFSINCADLLQYVGDGDVVEVLCDTERLMLPTLGFSTVLACGHESRMHELLDKLKKGFVFTKDGKLQPGLTLAGKRELLDYFGAVADVIALHSSQPVYPFYGNLLGAVRQNDFIDHDIGGFDMLYLCSSGEPAAIRSEVVSLCGRLVEAGFQVAAKPHSLMIRHEAWRGRLLDLSYGWFDPTDNFNVSYGWRFDPAMGSDRFVEPRYCRLVDRDVPVPGNAEQVLAQLYGPHWQIPDQGLSTGENLKRVSACLLSAEDIQAIEQLTTARD